MIEMNHTEEGVEEADLFTGEENQPINDVAEKCNTALEILQNELMNCERSISLEKSVRKQNEGKFDRAISLKEISHEITADYILNENNKSIDSDVNFASNLKDIFSNDQYCELIENIIRVGNHFNEIEEDDVQKIIFEYAEVNEIGHGFDKASRRTGNEWYQRFIRLHPQLNSVIKKSGSDCVRLDETDSSFSSRIVDKFLSDYKNIRKDETKIEEPMCKNSENEKYLDLESECEQKLEPTLTISCRKDEQAYLNNIERSQSLCIVNDTETFKKNESSSLISERSALTIEGLIENAGITTDSKQMYSSPKTYNLGVDCFPDTSDCVENGKNEEFFNSVSSLYSKNACPIDESKNTSNESKRKSDVPFESNAELKVDDGCGKAGKNVNNSTIDALPINIICDSAEIPQEDSGVINDLPSAEKTNCSPREDSSRNGRLDMVSNETVETVTETNGNDGIIVAENLTNGSAIFSEKACSLSNLETSRLIGGTLENLEKTESTDQNLSPVNIVSKFWHECNGDSSNNSSNISIDPDATPVLSGQTALNQKKTLSPIDTKNERDGKKSKISKKKRPSSLRKIKKSKYLYKLKSYSGSMLYFTSSTSVSFIKPVIKLTKLDESACENSDDIITAVPNAAAPSEANDIHEVMTNSDAGLELKILVEAKLNSSAGCMLEDHTGAETSCNPGNNRIPHCEAKTKSSCVKSLKELAESEVNLRFDNDLKEQVQQETNLSLDNDFKKQIEMKASSSPNNELDEQNDVKLQSIAVDATKCENEKDSNLIVDSDLKQLAKPLKTIAKKKVDRLSDNYEGATPVTKTNTSSESSTPTFGMQTRRKRLKFLPDGTLVTPNQRLQQFQDEPKSTSRSESKIAKKRSLKTSSQDTHKSEKKMKTVFALASSTPKQSNRSTVSTKKVLKNRPDRYIPKPNGQSKKPQKIFDYDSYYRENFRQTEVKLPPSCKKQMVALSKVTSISPGAQSGGLFTVNPAQLLSCLLGMPITPDQIRTVRFKPPNKQRKPNKQVNITPSKLASNDAIKPITKRHLELLQKTPFNIVPKSEIDVAKSSAITKSYSSAQ